MAEMAESSVREPTLNDLVSISDTLYIADFPHPPSSASPTHTSKAAHNRQPILMDHFERPDGRLGSRNNASRSTPCSPRLNQSTSSPEAVWPPLSSALEQSNPSREREAMLSLNVDQSIPTTKAFTTPIPMPDLSSSLRASSSVPLQFSNSEMQIWKYWDANEANALAMAAACAQRTPAPSDTSSWSAPRSLPTGLVVPDTAPVVCVDPWNVALNLEPPFYMKPFLTEPYFSGMPHILQDMRLAGAEVSGPEVVQHVPSPSLYGDMDIDTTAASTSASASAAATTSIAAAAGSRTASSASTSTPVAPASKPPSQRKSVGASTSALPRKETVRSEKKQKAAAASYTKAALQNRRSHASQVGSSAMDHMVPLTT